MPELEAVQRTANRVRDMWEASGGQSVKLMEFAQATGSSDSVVFRRLRTAADEGLIEKVGWGKGYLPILQEAN